MGSGASKDGNNASSPGSRRPSETFKPHPPPGPRPHGSSRSRSSRGWAGVPSRTHSAGTRSSIASEGFDSSRGLRNRIGPTSWVLLSFRAPERALAHGILAQLEDNGLHIRGGDAIADGSADRMGLISEAGVFLAVVGPAYERSKRAKAEFIHAISCDVPVAVVLGGQPGYRPKAAWLRSAVKAGTNVVDFQRPEDFDVNMALLTLQLNPSNFTDLAREMSAVAHDVHAEPVHVEEAVDALRSALTMTGEEKVRECRRGLRQLVGGALTPEDAKRILSVGGIEVVLSAVSALERNAEVAAYGCWVLMHLAARSRDTAGAIVASDGVEVLCRLAKRHNANSTVQQQCCLALFYFAQHGVCVTKDGVQTAAAAAARHSSDSVVALAAVRALHQSLVTANALRVAEVHGAFQAPSIRATATALQSKYDEASVLNRAAVAFVEELDRANATSQSP